MSPKPTYALPRDLVVAVEQAIARGDDEQAIADHLRCDTATIRRVHDGMDEAVRRGSGPFTDPVVRERKAQAAARARKAATA